MSVEKAFREMIRAEIETQLKPLRDVVARLEAGASDLNSVRAMAERLAPLADAVGTMFGTKVGGAAAARRGPGRPARNTVAAAKSAGGKKGRGGRAAAASGGTRQCAIEGCPRPSRSKGYCAAHYQKRRMLERTKRLPNAWVEDAAPHSVPDVKLKRGRAASKELAAQRG